MVVLETANFRKTIHTSYGEMDVAILRDHNGDYEPQLIKKYQNTVTQDMEEKILSTLVEYGASNLVYDKTNNQQLGMIAGIQASMESAKGLNMSDAKLDWSNKGEVIYPATINEHINGWHGGNFRNSLPGELIVDIHDFDQLYKELCDNNIEAQLYEHERITNVEFLENLVETYYEINEEITDRIDAESE